MGTIILQNRLYREKKTSATAIEPELQEWRSSFVISAALGGISGSLGLTLCVLAWFATSGSYHFLDNLGAGFLIAAFLTFSFAAHSLDKAREAETAIRIDRCKRTGMIGYKEK